MTIDLDVVKENIKKSYVLEKQLCLLSISFLLIAIGFGAYSSYFSFSDETLIGILASLTASFVFWIHGQSQWTKSVEAVFSAQGYCKKVIHDQTFWEDHYHFLYEIKAYKYDDKTEHLKFSMDLRDINNIYII